MADILILSSFVAGSRIGGFPQSLVVAAESLEPVLVPTVLFGASPAKGGQGQAVEAAHFERMLADAEAVGALDGLRVIVTGHFSSPEQVATAAAAIDRARARDERLVVLVDPILGDHPRGLYVKEAVAEAVVTQLVPRADWLTPNVWELGFITGQPTGDVEEALAAARRLEVNCLATSVTTPEGDIGALLVAGGEAHLLTHPRLPSAPNGTGDLLTAYLASHLAKGLYPLPAAVMALEQTYYFTEFAHRQGLTDLNMILAQLRILRDESPVRSRPIP